MHNGKGYDYHILLKKLGDFGKKQKMSAICTNSEKYISF